VWVRERCNVGQRMEWLGKEIEEVAELRSTLGAWHETVPSTMFASEILPSKSQMRVLSSSACKSSFSSTLQHSTVIGSLSIL
jgi:hypothetical protein